MSLNKIGLLILAMMAMGLNAIVTKVGIKEFPPLFFNFLRFVLLLPALFFIPRPQISWGALSLISLSLGVAMISLFNLALVLGATAGLAILILQTGSLFTILFDFLFCKTKPSKWDLIGIAFGLIGVYVISSSKGIGGGYPAICLLLTAALMYGLGFALAKKVKAPSFSLTVWMSCIAVPVLGIAAPCIEGVDLIVGSIVSASRDAWLAAFFAGWINMVAAGSILFYLNKKEGIAKTAPYTMLTPLFGCIFAALLLHEKFPISLYVGGFWILSGLAVSRLGLVVTRRLRGFFKI
jgi:O-acetylserine/cysteine efflux transporter